MMGDRSRPFIVCAACFHADPQNAFSLCYIPHHCRSPGMHRNAGRVSVTYHNGSLVQYHNGSHVRQPPSDRVMESVPRAAEQFTMCRNGPECRYGTSCNFPHNEEERRQWNMALERYRSRGKGESHTLITARDQFLSHSRSTESHRGSSSANAIHASFSSYFSTICPLSSHSCCYSSSTPTTSSP